MCGPEDGFEVWVWDVVLGRLETKVRLTQGELEGGRNCNFMYAKNKFSLTSSQDGQMQPHWGYVISLSTVTEYSEFCFEQLESENFILSHSLFSPFF